jgi:hypothetical protein
MRKILIAVGVCAALTFSPQARAAGYGIDPSGGAPRQTQTQSNSGASPLMILLSLLGLAPSEQVVTDDARVNPDGRGFGIDPDGRGGGIDPDGGGR